MLENTQVLLMHACVPAFALFSRFNIASQENLGNYSCVFGGDAKFNFVLAGNDHQKQPDNRSKRVINATARLYFCLIVHQLHRWGRCEINQ